MNLISHENMMQRRKEAARFARLNGEDVIYACHSGTK